MTLIFSLVLACTCLSLCQGLSPKLGKYKISDVTVSGISSGAYMAVQTHIAHSSIINGSATFAGGPFYCAESNLLYAEKKCMSTTLGSPEIVKLGQLTWDDFALGLVDNPRNLYDDKVYIFSGRLDSVVNPTVVHSLQSYYEYFVKSANIIADYNIDAEHCLPTLDYGLSCGTLGSPYIGKCNFDGAGMALRVLYGDHLVEGQAVPSNLMAFDQTGFIPSSPGGTSLGNDGYIYVPTSCAQGQVCHLHISFHGCNQCISQIGNMYADKTGFNRWAEANNIIVLYPYVEPNTVPYNPNGCWDWWSYTGFDYGVKSGVQIQFVKSLIDHIRI